MVKMICGYLRGRPRFILVEMRNKIPLLFRSLVRFLRQQQYTQPTTISFEVKLRQSDQGWTLYLPAEWRVGPIQLK
jgi:hypothetical protein